MKTAIRLLLFLVVLIVVLILSQWHSELSVEELENQLGNAPSRWVEVNGMPVHYRDEGSGPVLLLLHGTGSNLHTWQAWTDTLKNRYRIVRLDLPGFGLTGPLASRDYSMSSYSDFLDNFLAELLIDSCAVAGNSLGGMIAWNFALDHPDRVSRLVLIDAAGFPSKTIQSIGFRVARTPVFSALMTRVTPKFLVRKSLLEVYAEPDLVTDSLVDLYFLSMLRAGNRQAFIDRAQTEFVDRTGELGQLELPTLILWGEQDSWIPVENGYRFEQAIPGAELMVYPGAGHIPQEEIPMITARTTEGYLCASGW
jgi:pimeloyl-ACP methyl ester carboxylesterase